MIPAVTTREATPQDEEFLRRLFLVVRAPEFEASGLSGEPLDQILDQQFRAMRAHYATHFPETVYTLLCVNAEPIGYEAVRETHEFHLIDISLLPEYRNQGLGTARMKLLMDRATVAKKNVLLSVEIFNPAKHLYDRLGFQEIESAHIYVRMLWRPPQ